MRTRFYAGEHPYVRGAFAVFRPGDYPNRGQLIPFRFNPEGLSRSLQIEQAPGGQGAEGAQRRGGGSGGAEQAADASTGALKESFSILIRLDLIDREAASPSELTDDLKLGLLPEIAALEELMYPAVTDAQATQTGREGVAARGPRPTVLLVWGTHRVFPVKVASMTVNETLHNEELAPVRAEIEIGLELVREGDARENLAVGDALAYASSKRAAHARKFYERAANQGTRVADVTARLQAEGGGRR
jgi:hypothetical protein